MHSMLRSVRGEWRGKEGGSKKSGKWGEGKAQRRRGAKGGNRVTGYEPRERECRLQPLLLRLWSLLKPVMVTVPVHLLNAL